MHQFSASGPSVHCKDLYCNFTAAQAAEQAGDTAGKAMVQDGESALKKVEEVINNVDKVLKQQQEKSESPMTW